jgi:hypothetical protein
MAAIDYNNLLNRCCEAEKAILQPLLGKKFDTLPLFFHEQESYPYITHRIEADTLESDSEDFDRDNIVVVIRVIIGHATGNYKGAPETMLYQILPLLKLGFNENEELQSTKYPDAMLGLLSSRIGRHNGLRAFRDAGINAIQVGSELRLNCEIDESIEPDYL